MEVTATGKSNGKPFQAQHLLLTSLRAASEALLQQVRDRWSIESWHWIRDTQLHEDSNRFQGNGAGAMASLRTADLNLLRLAGFRSIRTCTQAVMHDIKHCWRWCSNSHNQTHDETLNQPWQAGGLKLYVLLQAMAHQLQNQFTGVTAIEQLLQNNGASNQPGYVA